jgi:hypothetical protein
VEVRQVESRVVDNVFKFEAVCLAVTLKKEFMCGIPPRGSEGVKSRGDLERFAPRGEKPKEYQ